VGNILKQRKYGWKFQKRSSEILTDENRKYFWQKVKLVKFSTESEKFSETEGNLKQRGMHHCLKGDGRPWWLQTQNTTAYIGPIRNMPKH